LPHSDKSDTTQEFISKDTNPAVSSLPGLSLFGIEQKWWVLIAVGAGTFMGALDGSVVNTVLPIINSSFHSNVASVEWVVIIYLLVLSGVLLSFGRLGDMRGHKPVYLAGFFIFVISSALCGLSSSILMLVVFRGVQAFGAAMLAANSPAILTKSFPAEQRGQALGLQATMTYLGLTVGPSLGGWLTQQFSWRAVFYINIPVGFLALLLSFRAIARDEHIDQGEKFDITGALVFVAGLIALLLGLNQGQEWGWTSPTILFLLAAAAVILAVFVFIEQRVPNPMLDLTLFQRRLFSASVASAIVNYICVYSILFIMPFYLIEGRGLNPAQAGLLLTAQPIIMAISAPISGTISDRIGARLPSTIGMAILGGGIVLLSRLGPQSSFSMIIFSLGIAGLGTGIFISPNNSALLGSAPRHRQGIASGILATARNVGMVLGIGLAGAIFTTILARGGGQDILFTAVHYSFLAAVGVAFLGFLTSAIRGNDEK
jgi:EmrB/QacA subfamily drug resistance transporter